MPDVITIGTATLDVILPVTEMKKRLDNNQKPVLMLPHGTKLEITGVQFETGGGATNCATTFARQGFRVSVSAKIGSDISGEKVLTGLSKERIDTSRIVIDKHDQTDFTTILYSPGEGTVLLISRGTGKLEKNEVDWDTINAKWLYISAVEGNFDLLYAVGKKKQTNEAMKIAWNPGKKELIDSSKITELLPSIELFILNRNEAALFTMTEWDHIHEILKSVASYPAKTKLVTDGQRGAYYHDGKTWWHSDAYHRENPESTGAGDAFGSAFVSGLIHGYPVDECMHLASANAASVVSHPGAKKGILTKAESDEWMKRRIDIEQMYL